MILNRFRGSMLIAAFLVAASALAQPVSVIGFRPVPEMERPEGIVYESKAERRVYEKSAAARQGLERFEAAVRTRWPEIRALDLVELSRYQVELTRGFELPAEPGELAGQAVGRDAGGRWHLELRGPRLPARYDIVHRYLHFYAVFDPPTAELTNLVVTIRGWVLE